MSVRQEGTGTSFALFVSGIDPGWGFDSAPAALRSARTVVDDRNGRGQPERQGGPNGVDIPIGRDSLDGGPQAPPKAVHPERPARDTVEGRAYQEEE